MNVEQFPEPIRRHEVEAAKKVAEKLLYETKDDPTRRQQIIADLKWFQDVRRVITGDSWDFSEAERRKAEQNACTERYRDLTTKYNLTDEVTPDGLRVLIKCLERGTLDVPISIAADRQAEQSAA